MLSTARVLVVVVSPQEGQQVLVALLVVLNVVVLRCVAGDVSAMVMTIVDDISAGIVARVWSPGGVRLWEDRKN